MTAWMVIILVLLVGARCMSWMYKGEGREIYNPSLIDDATSDWLNPEDELLVADNPGTGPLSVDDQAGADVRIVGVAVLSWIPASTKCATRRRKVGKAFIRGWAVRPSFRDKGIGRSLLKEVARVYVKERGTDSVSFAEDFARIFTPCLFGANDS